MEKSDLKYPVPELNSIRDFIRWSMSQMNAAQVFLGHGTDNVWDESLALVLCTLHLDTNIDDRMLDAMLTQREKEILIQRITQRVEHRIPTPYLTQTAWLSGASFFVDQRVIIPRSPIAQLIEEQFAPWLDPAKLDSDEPIHILDMCTGSGCLAILSALYIEQAQVDAVDVSEQALEVAQINVDQHQLSERVNLVHSDLFTQLPLTAKYDVIIANPPYVDPNELAAVAPEYQHEPRLALVDQHQGIGIAKEIVTSSAKYLTPKGCLILEVGNSQSQLEAAFPTLEFLWLDFARGGQGVCLITQDQLESIP